MCEQVKYTKQGVRDLSHIKAKSVGRKLEMPPVTQMCDHPADSVRETVSLGEYVYSCGDCGHSWTHDWPNS